MRYFLIFVTLLTVAAAQRTSANPTLLWDRTYNNALSNSTDNGRAVIVDPSGNPVIGGTSRDNAGAAADIFLIHYDPDGNENWQARFDNPSTNWDVYNVFSVNNQWMVTDASGNIYTCGWRGDLLESTHDWTVIKYLPNGTKAWDRTHSGPASNWDEALAVAWDGTHLIVVGSSYSADDRDYYVVKYDAAGNETWSRRWNGPGDAADVAYDVGTDASGNVYVTGATFQTGNDYDIATIKYNSAGTFQWEHVYNGPGSANDDYPVMAVDAAGNIFIAARSAGSGTDHDFAIIKLTSAGTQSWVRRYDGPASSGDIPYCIRADGAGAIYVAGQINVVAGVEVHVFIRKYNSDGTVAWSDSFRGTSLLNNLAKDIEIDALGDVYLAGLLENTATGGDAFVRKYSPSGGLLWSEEYTSAGTNADGANDLSVWLSDIYVGGFVNVAGQGVDYLLLKYCQACPSTFTYEVTPTTTVIDMATVVAADMDGDNYTDFVTTGRQAGDKFRILYGSPGTMWDAIEYDPIANSTVVVDLVDTDTLPDIVAHTGTQVRVFRNDGARSFTDLGPVVASARSANTIPAVTTGYFDTDAYLDIVAGANQIKFGDGSGLFSSSGTLPFSFQGVATADLNSDAIDDLVTLQGDSLVLYTNNGFATFTRTSAIRMTTDSFTIATIVAGVDFNADAYQDLAAISCIRDSPADTSRILVALGNGAGGILATDTFSVLGQASQLNVVDVDGDNDLDLATVNGLTRSMELYLGNSTGSFPDSLSAYLGASSNPLQALAGADLDRDGNLDFINGGSNTAVLISESQLPDANAVLPDEMVTTAYDNLILTVTNPSGLTISGPLRTVAGSAYWRTDVNANGKLDTRSYDYNLQLGEYRFVVRPGPGFGLNDPVTTGIRVDGSAQLVLWNDYKGGIKFKTRADVTATDSMVFIYTVESTPSVLPRNAEATNNLTPTFDWTNLTSLPSGSKYQFQLDRYYDFRNPMINDSTLTVRVRPTPSPMPKDSVFYWRVRSFDGALWSPYSHTFATLITGCCTGATGNLDADPGDLCDPSDLQAIVDYIFFNVALPSTCAEENDLTGDAVTDPSDLQFLVDYIFFNLGTPPPCP